MNRLFLHLLTIFFIFPLFACQKSKKESIEIDNKSYINNFELLQENSKNNTRIKINSPKAIIDPINNDIEIFDSFIQIIKSSDPGINIKSGKSTLNNYNNIIKVYDNVNISLLNTKNSFIETNTLDWDLNNSIINLYNPLYIYFDNTSINSSNGFYNIDSGELNINNNIFNRNIFNNNGELIYKINISAEKGKWNKASNLLKFTSNEKQVETTIDFLSIK